MANRAFLVASSGDKAAAPTTERILVASSGCVPIFWLAPFADADLVTDEGPTLLVERKAGLARARERQKKLLARFPKKVAPFFDQLLALLEGAGSSHVQVVVSDLVAAAGADVVTDELRASLRALESGKPDDLAVLLDRSSLELDEGGKRVSLRGSGAEVGADLRGYPWERKVPWTEAAEEALDHAWIDDPEWSIVLVRCEEGETVEAGRKEFGPTGGTGWALIPGGALRFPDRKSLEKRHETISLTVSRKEKTLAYEHWKAGKRRRSVACGRKWSAEGKPEDWEAVAFADPARLARSLATLEEVVRGAGGAKPIRALADAKAEKLRAAFAAKRVSSDQGELPEVDAALLESLVAAIVKQFGLPVPVVKL